MEHISRRETILSICTMEKRGGERPPKYGKFSYNGKMGVQLGTQVKDVKESFLVQLSKYIVLNQIAD